LRKVKAKEKKNAAKSFVEFHCHSIAPLFTMEYPNTEKRVESTTAFEDIKIPGGGLT